MPPTNFRTNVILSWWHLVESKRDAKVPFLVALCVKEKRSIDVGNVTFVTTLSMLFDSTMETESFPRWYVCFVAPHWKGVFIQYKLPRSPTKNNTAYIIIGIGIFAVPLDDTRKKSIYFQATKCNECIRTLAHLSGPTTNKQKTADKCS